MPLPRVAMAEHEPGFLEIQRAFTAHVRNPGANPAPEGLEDRRIGVYRELLYNNIESFMSGSFPVVRSLFADDDWNALVREYFAGHVARTPLFPKLPQEFLQYLAETELPPGAPVFLRELAHYEWLELEVSLDKREIGNIELDPAINCLAGFPVINPVARVHAYAFPVHRISPDYQPAEPLTAPTYLAVWRRRNDDVGFMELNPMTARLVELILGDTGRSGRKLLEQIAAELQHPVPAIVIDGGAKMFSELIARELLLGAR
jgi:hypothetical protein